MSAMTGIEILEQLKNLPPVERLKIVESTVHQLREDLERSGAQCAKDANAELTRAAEALLGDYTNDRELTAFTALDGEVWLLNLDPDNGLGISNPGFQPESLRVRLKRRMMELDS